MGYQVSDKLDVIFGARSYEYEVDISSDVDFPLLYTSIVPEVDDFRTGDEIILNLLDVADDDSGSLLKLNASYKFSDDVLGYVTLVKVLELVVQIVLELVALTLMKALSKCLFFRTNKFSLRILLPI